MNAIGYTRISTLDQSEYSLDHQSRVIKEYCIANKVDLLEIFVDNGESSYSFDRPDWKKLEAFIKKTKCQYLIIADHDRLSRNLAEALMKIKELQTRYGIKVLATTDSFDTDFSDPSTFIMRAFKYMMAESELHRIRQRTKNGVYQAISTGRFVNMAPFGYLNSRDDNGKPLLRIDPDKAPLVQMIFKLYHDGLSIEEIRTIARKNGFQHSSNSAVQRILGNPLYAGLIKVPKMKDKPEHIIKAVHEPIIPQADYWAIQDRLNGKHIRRQNNEEVPLRGALRCWCGRLLTAGNSKGKRKYYWYYQCKTHEHYLPAKKLHDQFAQMLDILSFEPEKLKFIETWLMERIGEEIMMRDVEKDKAERSLKEYRAKGTSIEERYLMEPDLTPATYHRAMAGIKAKQAELEKKIAEMNTSADIIYMRLKSLIPKLSNLRERYDDLPIEKKHQFIKAVFDNSLTHDGDTYRTPYLDPIFSDKELILKEKGLLIKEQPVIKIGQITIGTQDGS